MSELVLVAVPYKVGVSNYFIRNIQKLYASLTFKNKELCLFPNSLKPDGRQYGQHAQARNLLIETSLRDSHTHVLWLDVDLVDIPNNLIERLFAVDKNGIVAPFVFVELREEYVLPSMENGGWFYDTGGFKFEGGYAQPFPPYFNKVFYEPALMGSVGCCYIAPAQAYRDGCDYNPTTLEVEHVSFCRQAIEKGYKVWADPHTKVKHAFLPKYGEAWHS